jgi:histidinol dehydrogenase
MIRDLNPGSGKIFVSSSKHPQVFLGSNQPPIEWVTTFVPGGKAAGT